MKNMYLICVCLLLSVSSLFAQKKDNSAYLFDEFKEASVVYKDGRRFVVDLNYDLANNAFLFIDKEDNNLKKEFGEPQKISAVKVGDRTFLPQSRGGAIEVLQFDPVIYVQLKGKLRAEDKKTAYGGRSGTSAVDSYSSFSSAGKSHRLETEGYFLTGIDKVYQVFIGGKKKTFANDKQYLKIYPKYKEEIEQYLQQNEVDFDVVEDVIELCNYTFGLDK